MLCQGTDPGADHLLQLPQGQPAFRAQRQHRLRGRDHRLYQRESGKAPGCGGYCPSFSTFQILRAKRVFAAYAHRTEKIYQIQFVERSYNYIPTQDKNNNNLKLLWYMKKNIF